MEPRREPAAAPTLRFSHLEIEVHPRAQGRRVTGARCKDCEAEGRAAGRPAPHPGPRCATHHRAITKARKLRAAQRRVETTYGLSAADYDALFAAQGGVCAICQRATGRTRRLAVDHDHTTGHVRGLLCSQCNYIVIGRYDVNALGRAIGYLADPPAPRALGRQTIVPERNGEEL